VTPPNPVPPSPSSSKARPRSTLRLFALGAAALVVSGALLAIGMPHSSTSPAAHGTDASHAVTPVTAQADAVARLNSLADLGADVPAAIRDATMDSAAALGAGPLAAALADAQAQRDALLKDTALPALPDDFIPGMDLGAHVKVPKPAAFPLPSYSGSLSVAGLEVGTVLADDSGAAPPSGPHAPATGVGAADARQGQGLQGDGTLENLLGSAPTGLPDLPAPTGLPAIPGVPGVPGVPGLTGYPAGDANSAVDPDEHGAVLSSDHAVKLLSSVEGAYAVSQPSLAAVLANYQSLAARAQALVDDAHNATTQADEAIHGQLDGRLAAIQDAADKAEAQANQLVGAYSAAAKGAVQKAQAALQGAASAQADAIQSAVEGDVGRLTALAEQVQSLAESRKADIQATVNAAAEQLSRLQGDASAGVPDGLPALQAAGQAALQKVNSAAAARVQAIQAAATDLQARAQSALRHLAPAAMTASQRLNDTLADALGHAGDVKEYLVGVARAQAEAATAAEQGAADAALAKLPSLEQARVSKVVDAALKMADAAAGAVHSVDALLDRVANATSEKVGQDIRYIGKVSSDYKVVPTPERSARATFWSTVAGASSGRLDGVLSATHDLDAMARQVLQAAQQAKAQIEDLA
jgi:hypothetical protein